MPRPKYTLLGDATPGFVSRANEMIEELYELLSQINPHDLLSTVHGDTRVDPEQDDVQRGDIIVGQHTPQGGDVIRWQRFAIGAAATVLKTTDGIDLVYGKVVLTSGATQEVTGTLPILNGGTGNTAYTAGSVIFAGPGTPPTQLIEDATNLTFNDSTNQLVVGGSVRTPIVIGGTGVDDDLKLRATSGVGTTNSRIFLEVGTNGAIQACEIKPDAGGNFGQLGIGTPGNLTVDGPLVVFGTGSDIGYVIKARAANNNASCFCQLQTAAIDANAQAGFEFHQQANDVQWRMSVVGNDGNAMRWTSVAAGSPTNRAYFTVNGNFILDATRAEPTTGTKGLIFGDGTALATMASNTAGLYADDVGGTVELLAINEAGELTRLTGNVQIGSGKRLHFGGDTSSQPALKANSAELQARLADDSAFASFQCAALTVNTQTGNVAGTVYTPVRSAEVNLDANVTMFEAQYARVGNTVTVSGRFTADPTTTLTATSFEMTLPVASNIGAVEDLAGGANCGAIAGQSAQISGSVANNTAVVTWVAVDVTSQSWSFWFQYQVI